MSTAAPTSKEIAAALLDAKKNLETALWHAIAHMIAPHLSAFDEAANAATLWASLKSNEISSLGVELEDLAEFLDKLPPPPGAAKSNVLHIPRNPENKRSKPRTQQPPPPNKRIDAPEPPPSKDD